MGKWTRRAVLTTGVVAGGGLLVGVALRMGHRAPKLAPLVTGADETLVNAWVKLGADNATTVIVPHSEMGQGAQTALMQMLADEMDADWDTTTFMEAPAFDEYANYAMGKGFILGDAPIPSVLVPTVDGLFFQITKSMHLQVTGGSASIRTTGVYGMRIAGSAARQMLLSAAASAWQVPVGELATSHSYITHEASNRRAPYSEFAAAAAEMTPPATPKLKPMKDFQLMGKSVPRRDIPAKVDGTAQFAMDVSLPDMVYATIQRAPVFGGKLKSVDASAASSQPGVLEVVSLDNAVAVVAQGYWQARQALAKVSPQWDTQGLDKVSSESIFAQFEGDLDAGTERKSDLAAGDVAGAFAAADQVVTADYRVPYLAHACMEPVNATAWVHDGICEIWVGCQNPLGFKHAVAEALSLDVEDVTLHNHFMGGGFGRKASPDWVIQAAQLADKVRRPVQLVWSREEDMRQDNYRPAIQSRFRAALNAQGKPIAWENSYVDKHEPAEAPLIPYAIAAQDIGHVSSPTHVPFGPWRSVDHSQHGFFTESFIDEVAAASDADPFELRLELLSGKPRHQAVLKLAAEQAEWGTPLPKGRGRGIALQESFGSLVAQVVEVTVVDGNVSVDRVVAAVDAGFAVSPDGLTAQIESGIVYGLTAALYGEITIDDGAAVQSNFHDYQALRMNEAPTIETHIINSGVAWGGAGEPGTPGIAPALANAVFNATGTRVRQLPLKNYDLRYRVEEQDEVG